MLAVNLAFVISNESLEEERSERICCNLLYIHMLIVHELFTFSALSSLFETFSLLCSSFYLLGSERINANSLVAGQWCKKITVSGLSLWMNQKQLLLQQCLLILICTTNMQCQFCCLIGDYPAEKQI